MNQINNYTKKRNFFKRVKNKRFWGKKVIRDIKVYRNFQKVPLPCSEEGRLCEQKRSPQSLPPLPLSSPEQLSRAVVEFLCRSCGSRLLEGCCAGYWCWVLWNGSCAGFWRVVNSVRCLRGGATTCHLWMQSLYPHSCMG